MPERRTDDRVSTRHWPADPWRADFRRRLLAWFTRHRRDLPWRQTRDPYHVWISEVMLQQTQVATVVPYFQRFIAAFPTLADLASADEQDVLRLWEGLGYYRRARQLHRAAQVCMVEHQGRFPDQYESVRGLPGIGRYTAGAILSISGDQRLPIVEANTVRLYSRLMGYRGDPHGTSGQRLLWEAAEQLLPPRRGSGDVNQALMELGATVCLPSTPRCPACPAAALCQARTLGLQGSIPPAKRKPAITAVREAAVVVRQGPRVLLSRSGDGGRWAGLWDFLRFPIQAIEPEALASEISFQIRERTGMAIKPGQTLTTLTHGVTRFRITLTCVEARWLSGRAGRRGNTTTRWFRAGELGELPMNTTGRKLARLAVAPRNGQN
jgi:A/G-specific adenine glycosylase